MTMKEHIYRELVNDLRDIAIKYHGHQCLRELIRSRVAEALTENVHWYAVAEIRRSVESVFKK